ncbi:MAG TPA: hypothetical protein DCL66_04035 [Gammaproteobacteria bacterium]|nr:hypothetical protein [Gammaproteobacteria bacterium]
MIPARIPNIGGLDDAMFVEIIVRERRIELEAYKAFCRFRLAEEERLSVAGVDPEQNHDQRLKAKRGSIANGHEICPRQTGR